MFILQGGRRMKEGFLIRVCVSCAERLSKVLPERSVYGCRLDDDIRDCLKREDDGKVTYCDDFFCCSIRTSKPDKDTITGGYCQSCTSRLIKK